MRSGTRDRAQGVTLFINNGRMIQIVIMYLFLISLYSNKLRGNNFTVLIESKYQNKYICSTDTGSKSK